MVSVNSKPHEFTLAQVGKGGNYTISYNSYLFIPGSYMSVGLEHDEGYKNCQSASKEMLSASAIPALSMTTAIG